MYYNFCSYRYSSVTLASLLLVLEEIGFGNFMAGMIQLVDELKIPFDFIEVESCRSALIQKFHTQA